ncbi:hypothetical protein ACH3XW_42885 [Acanthocheilonema viteae]
MSKKEGLEEARQCIEKSEFVKEFRISSGLFSVGKPEIMMGFFEMRNGYQRIGQPWKHARILKSRWYELGSTRNRFKQIHVTEK